jgi:hypothetical protein
MNNATITLGIVRPSGAAAALMNFHRCAASGRRGSQPWLGQAGPGAGRPAAGGRRWRRRSHRQGLSCARWTPAAHRVSALC